MRVTKKCAICGYEFTYDNKIGSNPMVAPHDDGARYYYDLWHYFIERCPECGYASKDISVVENKYIIKDIRYTAVQDMPIILTLEGARPNRIADYICAGMYYESIGDDLDYARCMLQASDLVYNEMMYWDEYVYDNSHTMGVIQNKSQNEEFTSFADGLFSKGVDALDNFVREHPADLDASILFAGILNTGDRAQKIKGAGLLSRLKSANLSNGQKLAVKFLLNRVR